MTNDEFFDQADRTVWRLEAQRQYNPRTDQAYQEWLRTGRLLPLRLRPGKLAWMAAVEASTAAGKRVGRVRFRWGYDDPHPYAAYELACYLENQAAGEVVALADLGAHPELAGLRRDFWLFDDALALLMDYDDDGQFLAMAPTRDPAILARGRAQRDLAVAASVPLNDYLADMRSARAG